MDSLCITFKKGVIWILLNFSVIEHFIVISRYSAWKYQFVTVRKRQGCLYLCAWYGERLVLPVFINSKIFKLSWSLKFYSRIASTQIAVFSLLEFLDSVANLRSHCQMQQVFINCVPIWLKSDLYLRYRIEDLITPHYWSCLVLIILTNQSLLLCDWK